MVGLSGYPSGGYSAIDDIIDTLIGYGSNCYRISFTPTYQSGSRPWRPEYVDYFLSHAPSGFKIIVDCNHHYGEGDINWTAVRERCLLTCNLWGNNTQQVLVEIVNEPPWKYPLYSNVQPIITAIRDQGYNLSIVQNKFNPRENWQRFTDPRNDTYQGFHLYINQYPLNGSGTAGMTWRQIMQGALDAGISKIVNTEVGADFREANYFTQSEVNELNEMLSWCADRGIGNTIWMNNNLSNLSRYRSLGLQMPPVQPPPEQYTVTISHSQGGNTNPSGSVQVNANTNLTITAIPASGYEFDHWAINGSNYGQNPITILVDHNGIQVNAIFSEISPPPPNYYNVNISHNQGGHTDPAGTVQVLEGNNLTITAFPDSGYRFEKWTIETQEYTQNPITINVTHTMNVYANFTQLLPPPPSNIPFNITPALFLSAATYALTGNPGYSVLAGTLSGLLYKRGG